MFYKMGNIMMKVGIERKGVVFIKEEDIRNV